MVSKSIDTSGHCGKALRLFFVEPIYHVKTASVYLFNALETKLQKSCEVVQTATITMLKHLIDDAQGFVASIA